MRSASVEKEGRLRDLASSGIRGGFWNQTPKDPEGQLYLFDQTLYV